MKLGGSEVLALRLGSKPVVAAYLGSTLVWTSGLRLSGALLATTALSGGLTVDRSLAGTVAAQAALAANAGVKRPIAGALAAISDASGDLTVSAQVLLHGALNAISALGGGLSVARTLAGTVTALSATAGAASVERVLAGAAAAVSVLAGTAKVRRVLAGSLSATASLAGSLDVEASGPTLAQKGYGHVYGASNTADLAMSYANVDGGSAPAAGDLVIWFALGYDTVASPVVDLTGSGWTQGSNVWNATDDLGLTILAKVVSAGDLSSPPTMIDDPTQGSIGFWVAYSVSGSVSSLSVPTPSCERAGADAPSNQVQNSAGAAPAYAITIGMGGTSSGTPSLTMTGATADITFTTAANVWGSSTYEGKFLVDLAAGGANITFSKSDDGSANHMASGYVLVN